MNGLFMLRPNTKRNERDIKFTALSQLDWSQGMAWPSTELVWKSALGHAETAVDWYLTERFGSGLGHEQLVFLRFSCCIRRPCTVDWRNMANRGTPRVEPSLGSGCSCSAATMVGIYCLFGFSAAYLRYLTAAMKLRRLMRECSLDWEVGRSVLAGGEPTPTQVKESIEASKRFLAGVDQIIQTETDSWVQEYTTALAEIDKAAQARTEAARGGAVNVTLTNADKSEDGWQLTVDNGAPEQRSGKTAAVRGLLAGTHTISVCGKIDGALKTTERNVSVSAGAIVELELTLA